MIRSEVVYSGLLRLGFRKKVPCLVYIFLYKVIEIDDIFISISYKVRNLNKSVVVLKELLNEELVQYNKYKYCEEKVYLIEKTCHLEAFTSFK